MPTPERPDPEPFELDKSGEGPIPRSVVILVSSVAILLGIAFVLYMLNLW